MKNIKEKIISLIKKIERYTETDMIYLIKGGFWLGIGQFFSSGSAFIISLAFANLLSPDLFGIYKYVISINSLILITTLSGMDSAIIQAVSRGYDGSLKDGVKAKMKWGVIGTVVSFLISLYYYLQGNNMMSILFSISAIFVPFSESLDMYNSLLFGKKLFNIQTKYNIIKKIVLLLSMVSVLIITKNIYLIVLIYFLAITVPNIFLYFKTLKYKNNNNSDIDTIKYGKHLSVINIMTLILAEIDKVLLFHFAGAVNLAIYSLAIAPTDQLKGIMKNINSLALPKFSEKNASDIKKGLFKKIFILGLISLIVIGLYIIISPFFFKIFFPKYLASINYSRFFSISLIGAVISGFLYTILESQKAKEELYYFNLYNNIFGIIIMVPFVYYFGIWGAISARMINRFLSVIVSWTLVKRLS